MPRLDRFAIAILTASLPFRLLLALATDLTPDEAYYLSATRLGVTVPDHPPLTVWLLAASDRLPAACPIELRTRLPSLLLGTLVAALVVDLVRRRGGTSHAQRWAAIFGSWLILPLAGGFLATPDAPAFLAAVALLHAEEQRSNPGAAATAALATFGGLIGKVILAPIALVFILFSRRGWMHKVAILLGLIAASPLCLRSFRFQLVHAYSPLAWSIPAVGVALGAAVAAQVGLWTPVVPFVGLRRSLWERPVDRALALALTALFLGSALIRAVPPEPNWIAPAWSAVIVAASLGMPAASSLVRRAAIALGPVLAVVLSTHAIQPWLPIARSKDPSARLHGWSTGQEGNESIPGVGAYGPAAERCVYRGECKNISEYFRDFTAE
ncbi:MAG: hypothetical protein HY898_13410 [Deltaproteobacteria bacterium]|nr:hypothetical protein [Deltaproteobacteria bacterium]